MNDERISQLPSIATILAPTDFSDGASAALRWAVDIARRHGARLELVHAIDASPVEAVDLDVQRAADGRLAEQVAFVRGLGVDATAHGQAGRPWEVIAERERKIGADLVVLGSRGHTHFERLRFGSVADRCVRTVRGPALFVHPGHGDPRHIQNALVPVDFSQASLDAAQAAKRLLAAAPERGFLVLLHACDLPIDYGVAVSVEAIAHAREDDLEYATRELNALADRLRNDQLDVECVVRSGYAPRVVREEAERLGVDLIAIGTHGRTGLSRFLIGSVAERVLHHAPCPVMTVRDPSVEKRGVGAGAAQGAVEV